MKALSRASQILFTPSCSLTLPWANARPPIVPEEDHVGNPTSAGAGAWQNLVIADASSVGANRLRTGFFLQRHSARHSSVSKGAAEEEGE